MLLHEILFHENLIEFHAISFNSTVHGGDEKRDESM